MEITSEFWTEIDRVTRRRRIRRALGALVLVASLGSTMAGSSSGAIATVSAAAAAAVPG